MSQVNRFAFPSFPFFPCILRQNTSSPAVLHSKPRLAPVWCFAASALEVWVLQPRHGFVIWPFFLGLVSKTDTDFISFQPCIDFHPFHLICLSRPLRGLFLYSVESLPTFRHLHRIATCSGLRFVSKVLITILRQSFHLHLRRHRFDQLFICHFDLFTLRKVPRTSLWREHLTKTSPYSYLPHDSSALVSFAGNR